jgi:TPR repeat protein
LAQGQVNLGLFYWEGRGVFFQQGIGNLPKSDREAARLYKLSADQGFAYAQFALGYFNESGLGGLGSDEEAARLYKLAADQDFRFAQYALGIFYAQGRGGLPKDDQEATRLLTEALSQ